MTWKGSWVGNGSNLSVFAYIKEDAVKHNGIVYISTANNIPIGSLSPDLDMENWNVLVTDGVSGASGETGASGSSGTSGEAGISGTSGENGSHGTSGTSGGIGLPGTSGTSGQDGSSGSAGTTGSSGSTGTSGSAGSSGTSGMTGTSGTSGAFTGTLTFTQGTDIPSASTVNDYNISAGSLFTITGTTASSITGFSNGVIGRYMLVVNGTDKNQTFQQENSGSLAPNRLVLGVSNKTIGINQTATFIYVGGLSIGGAPNQARWILTAVT